MSNHSHNAVIFENNVISLINNKLLLKRDGHLVALSKKQTVLLVCLINEINDRKDIIERIWPGSDYKSKINNYNQLIFQTRLLLANRGFPNDMLITMSRYGVCLNAAILKPPTRECGIGKYLFRDQGLFL